MGARVLITGSWYKRGIKLRKVKKMPFDFLAIGDLWFNYPLDSNILLPPFDFGIIAKSQLEFMGNPSPKIFSQAMFGQESTAVLSYKNQQRIINVLEDGSQWLNGKGPDAILISAGGNDIAGEQFAIYVDYGGTAGLNNDRFQGALDLVEASYNCLFALRDIFAPGVPIFGHCYDYAIPADKPAGFFAGPWLVPSLEFALYDTDKARREVVRDVIDKFYKMLSDFASKKKNNFILVDTRKTIASNYAYPNGWANEIHPYTPGFTALAKDSSAIEEIFSGSNLVGVADRRTRRARQYAVRPKSSPPPGGIGSVQSFSHI